MTDENTDPVASDVGEIPQGYSNIFTPDQWSTLDDGVRAGILERERRAAQNRSEQIDRLKGSMAEVARQEAQRLLESQNGNGKAKSNGGGSEWHEISDSEFNQLYSRAQDLRETARSNPDDEEAQRAAARVTPELLRQFEDERIRRKAHQVASEMLGERDQKQKTVEHQRAMRSRILRDFGANEGEAILREGHPLFEKAAEVHANLLADGGADTPELAYAAYKIAHLEANRGQADPVARRDQAIQNSARTMQAQFKERTTLRRKGDVVGAHKSALRDFLEDRPIDADSLPDHIRRTAQRR